MSTFRFNAKVNDPFADITDAALGSAAGQNYGDEEVGKAVKMGTVSNYVLCADGDPIEGFIVSTEPNTVNQGFSFGSVQRDKRILAQVDTGATLAVGDYVVSGGEAAVGTASKALVKPKAAVDTKGFDWRVVRIVSGAGTAGSVVLLERV